MTSFFVWLEATGVATTVRDSLILTGGLSAVHLIGFTLSTGGGLVANLNLFGILLPGRSPIEVSRPATRGILLGVAISIVTGAFLFAPRATVASVNPIFQTKMLLLLSAVVFHLAVHQRVARSSGSMSTRRGTALVGLLLWICLALAGCAFILLE